MNTFNLIKYYRLQKQKGESFVGHTHSDFEMNIVFSGCLEVTCDDEIFNLCDGDILIINAKKFHRNRVISDGITDFISLHFFCENMDEKIGGSPCRLSEKDIRLVEMIDSDISESQRFETYTECLLESLILRLPNKQAGGTQSTSPSAELYRKAVNTMKGCIDRSLTVRELSKACGVCMTTLKNAFFECAGMGVMSYFMNMKLAEATKMLQDGKEVGETALALGFSSPSYFSQCYKKKYGASPKKFFTKVNE